MISVDEAKRKVRDTAFHTKVGRIQLEKARDLVLAEDIHAPCAIPAFAQSSMDGYALRLEDLPAQLSIVGEIAAGNNQQQVLHPGETIRIFTGAPLPVGADTVVMQEKVAVVNGKMRIPDIQPLKGEHVRQRGSEIKQGEVALKKGTRLTVPAIGFLAGIGIDEVLVFLPPKIGIILTGDELQQPGKELAFGQVYESNSFTLKAALASLAIHEVTSYYAEDNLEGLTAVLKKALTDQDIVLLTGGVSVGDYDFVLKAAAACGINQVFHKVKQKPGKPLYFGHTSDRLVFGLPGNPSSVLNCFYQYVFPKLEEILHRLPAIRVKKAILQNGYRKPLGLTHFIKGFVNEQHEVTALFGQESYRMRSFAVANCLIRLEEDCQEAHIGQEVNVQLLPL